MSKADKELRAAHQRVIEKMRKPDKRNKALYAMFYIGDDGTYYGMTECSFSMGLSTNRVSIFRDDNHYLTKKPLKGRLPRTVKTDGNKVVTIVDEFYVRLSKKECGFKIDLSERRAMHDKTMAYDKYKWRNVPFTVVANPKVAQ